jgi:SnoaL-like domain
MAATPQETIEAAIERYLADDADGVLEQFHDNARIRGSKKGEKWNNKHGARGQLDTDLAELAISGDFVDPANTVASDLMPLGGGAVYLFDRTGEIEVTRKTGKKNKEKGEARWTAILEPDGPGWIITHSHFSFVEGMKTPKK